MLCILDLPDTKCVIIANHSIDQYTHYNIPSSFTEFSEEHVRWMRIFERLHNIYLNETGSKKGKGEFMIKRVYQTDTYLLYSKGKMLIYCVVDHKEASREPLEIGR